LRTDEKAIAGTPPDPRKNPERVYEARRALATAGLAEPRGALHVDSSPGKGWYWVYFRRWPDDMTGAEDFVHVLAEQSVNTRKALETGTPEAVARAMYARKYYEGRHVPTETYHTPDGDFLGAELNVRDYARAIARNRPSLADWTPGATRPDLDWALIDGLVAKGLDDLARAALEGPEYEYLVRGGNDGII
jgi:hypothetical protein